MSSWPSTRRSSAVARPLLLLMTLLPMLLIVGLFATDTLAAQSDEAPPPSRAGLCGPKAGTSEVEASKPASLSSDDNGTSRAHTTWIDPSDVPSCRRDADTFATEFVSHKHSGTIVSLPTYKGQLDRPSSSDDSSGADSSASSVAVAAENEPGSSSSEAAAQQLLAVPVAIIPFLADNNGNGNNAAGGARRLLQAGIDIARAVLIYIDQYLDSSAAQNSWPRERVTAVGLTINDAVNPSLLSFTVLYEGDVGEVRTLTARSVALVGDARYGAQVVGATYTTVPVAAGSLTYDDENLEQLRLNLGTPAGQQVVVPAAPVNPPPTPPPATTPHATTTAPCDPNACTVNADATEGWIFGDTKESCDTACSNYDSDFECIESELNTIDSTAKFAAVRAGILDCKFPGPGYCEALPLKSKSGTANAVPLFEARISSYAFLAPNTKSFCGATSSGTERLCYCRQKQ